MYTKDRNTQEDQTTHHAKHRAEDMFQESWESLQEKSTDFQEDIVNYIRDNPIKSVGIAAIFGILLAQLLRK